MRTHFWALASLILVSGIFGCSGIDKTTEVNSRIASAYFQAWLDHDVDKIMSLFADSCVYEEVPTGKVIRGKEKMRIDLENTFNEIPDFDMQLKSQIVSGNMAAYEYVMIGTDITELPNGEEKRQKFSVPAVSIVEFSDGKIKRNSDYWGFSPCSQEVQ